MAEVATGSLEALLSPRSIAVVGASTDPGKAGGRPVHYMLGLEYAGRLYPVNPHRDEVLSLRSYPSLADLPEVPDLCVLAVPVEHVEEHLRECGRLGVAAAIVFASGYAETGEEGRERQRRLREIALEHGIALAGPNCLGLVNVRAGVAPTFTTALERRLHLEAGPISFVSQSGAVGAFLLGMIQDEELGISLFITTGNEAVLELSDYVRQLVADPDTGVIAGYLEGADGPALTAVATDALRAGKPLVLMKVGASAAGAAASATHTGKLVGVDSVYDAAFRRYAITRAQSLEELLDFSRALSMRALPQGAGVGIVSTSGGAAILLADWCERLGLRVVDFSDATTARLNEALPWFAGRRNPVDTTGRPLWETDMMYDTLAAVAQDPGVDAVLCHVGLAPGPARRIADELVRAAETSDKPILATWLREIDPEPHATLRMHGIPVFSDPVRMTKTAAATVEYVRARAQALALDVAPDEIAVTPPPPGDVVPESAAREWLVQNGLPAMRERAAESPAAAVARADELGYPVCLKLLSPDVVHRSDIGAVRLDLADAGAVNDAYDGILAAVEHHAPEARIDGMLVQEQIGAEGVELIVSGFRDPVFGPCVLCGIGGILAEVMRDTVVRLAPIGVAEAMEMLDELRGGELLKGPRGRHPSDTAAVAAALARVSALMAGAPQDIDAIEINPLLALQEGAGVRVLDALITRTKERKG